MFSWLYDTRLQKSGIQFVVLRLLPLHLLQFSNIKLVRELHGMKVGPFNAFNFKNRLFSRAFLIETKTGWFTRRILVTPRDADKFVSTLDEHQVEVELS